MERSKRLFLAFIGLIMVIGVAMVIFFYYKANQPVPPPDEPPTDEIAPIQVDNLVFEANPIFWQNFMPIIPPEGPPFYLVLEIIVKNYGDISISDITAIKTTVYYAATTRALHTFKLEPSGSTNNSIRPGETKKFEYTNDRSTIFSPDLEEGTELYARILVRWASEHEVILTTPPAPVEFTY